jgi:hypothetical protein
MIAEIYVYRNVNLPAEYNSYKKYAFVPVMLILPSLGYSTLKFGEAGMDVAK